MLEIPPLVERPAVPAHRTWGVGRVFVIGMLLTLAVTGCGGADGPSAAESTRSVDDGLPPPQELRAGWNTDFSEHSVAFDEFMSGGPGKDGIPAIDAPRFVAVEDADFLDDREPVIELVVEREARA